MKKIADALRPDEPHGLRDLFDELLRRVARTAGGPRRRRTRASAGRGRRPRAASRTAPASSHMRKVENSLRAILHGGELEQVQRSGARGGRRSRSRARRRTCSRALLLELGDRAEQHAGGLRRHAADVLQVGLALVAGEVHEQGAEVGEVQQRELVAARRTRTRARARSAACRSSRAPSRAARGPNDDTRRPQRDPFTEPAERPELDGSPRRAAQSMPRAAMRSSIFSLCIAGCIKPGEVALHVGGEHRDAGVPRAARRGAAPSPSSRSPSRRR